MPMSGLMGFGVRNALDFAVRAKECRIVCLPGTFIQKLHAQAVKELEAEHAKNGGEEPKPFLSPGDVLTAWWARLTVGQLVSADSQRTITIQVSNRDHTTSSVHGETYSHRSKHAASARKALSRDFDTSSRPYISNMFTMYYSLMPARELLSKPLGWLAAEIRRAIVEQGTREQVEAYFALQRKSPGRVMPFFGDAGMHLMTPSNWCRANLYGHDFSPATVDPQQRQEVYPSYVQSTQLPFSFPEGTLIIGQDKASNYWIYGFRVKGLWAKVEKALAEMEYP